MSRKRVDAPALTLSLQLTEDEDAGLMRREAERLADEITARHSRNQTCRAVLTSVSSDTNALAELCQKKQTSAR
jgi:hypothetical protein